MSTHKEMIETEVDDAPPMFVLDQWHEIDTSNLTGPVAKSVKAYDDANDDMKLAREVMEDALSALVAPRIPAHLEARFAYRWGKKSVAAVEPRAKAKGGGKISL